MSKLRVLSNGRVMSDPGRFGKASFVLCAECGARVRSADGTLNRVACPECGAIARLTHAWPDAADEVDVDGQRDDWDCPRLYDGTGRI
jgi:PHP family Zn ribbon phosphoesterase